MVPVLMAVQFYTLRGSPNAVKHGTFGLSSETNLRFCSSIQALIRSSAPRSVDSLRAF
jgi:hypothetical protein